MVYSSRIITRILTVITVLLIIIINYTYIYDGTDWFTSTIDDKQYQVKNDTIINKQIKSNMLALRHILSLLPKLPERLK